MFWSYWPIFLFLDPATAPNGLLFKLPMPDILPKSSTPASVRNSYPTVLEAVFEFEFSLCYIEEKYYLWTNLGLLIYCSEELLFAFIWWICYSLAFQVWELTFAFYLLETIVLTGSIKLTIEFWFFMLASSDVELVLLSWVMMMCSRLELTLPLLTVLPFLWAFFVPVVFPWVVTLNFYLTVGMRMEFDFLLSTVNLFWDVWFALLILRS